MIRSYCGSCGQETTAWTTTCECPEDERIPMINMTQKDFNRSVTEAYQLGLDVMGERVSDLKVAVEVTARNYYQEVYAAGRTDGETSMRERAADLVGRLPNEVTVTDYHYRNGWRDACSYAEMRIRALEVKP